MDAIVIGAGAAGLQWGHLDDTPLTLEEQAQILNDLRRPDCRRGNTCKRTVETTETHKQCCVCNKVKLHGDFYSSKATRDKMTSQCRSCTARLTRERQYRWRSGMNMKKNNSRVNTINKNGKRTVTGELRAMDASNVTLDFVARRLEEQQFRCWLTSDLPHGGLWLNAPYKASLERLNQDVTYTEQNVKMIHIAFQSQLVQWTRDKVRAVPDLRQKSIDYEENLQAAFEWCTYAEAEAMHDKTIHARRCTDPEEFVCVTFATQRDAAEHVGCSQSGISQVISHDRTSTHGWVFWYKEPVPVKPVNGCPEMYKLVHMMVLNANDHTTKRQEKRNLEDSQISARDVLELLQHQKMRCAYLDVPVHVTKGNVAWKASLERLDNSKSYSKENCVIVAAEVNVGDQMCKIWSREFAEMVWRR